jgi:hypothetical protein
MADCMTSSRGANSDTVNTSINADRAYTDGTIPLDDLATAGAATNWFLNEWKNTHEYNRVNKYSDLAYDAAKKDSGLYIDTGMGNDTVANWGAGAWDVRLGVGNDTYYSGNTGDQRAVWVFNTRNQIARYSADRYIDDLKSDDNNVYAFKGELTVTLNLPNQTGEGGVLFDDVTHERPDYVSLRVAIPEISSGVISDLTINQAIKTAINTDPVLSKLLEAVDGPANTLVVRSRIDGVALDSFNPTQANGGSYSGLQVDFHPATGYTNTTEALASANGRTLTDLVAKGDYVSALAASNAAGTAEYTGTRDVNHTTANRVHIENGQDVVVLSTNADSQDVLVFDTAAGSYSGRTTVVHFSTEDATNTNQGNQAIPDNPVYNTGNAESFVVSFAQLNLTNAANPATVLFNGGPIVTLQGLGNAAGFPVTQPVDVVNAFFNQLQTSGSVNHGYTSANSTGLTFGAGTYTADASGNDDTYAFILSGGSATAVTKVAGTITIPRDGVDLLVPYSAGETYEAVGSRIEAMINASGIIYGGSNWTAGHVDDLAGNYTITLTETAGAAGATLAGSQITDFQPIQSSSTPSDDFYWYRDVENNVWQVEAANNGTGLKFTHINSPLNDTPAVGDVDYDDPATSALPTARVDNPLPAHFVWQGVGTQQPASIPAASVVPGVSDGQGARSATIEVDYAGSAAAYTDSFVFGDPNAPVATVNILRGDGDITIAQKVTAAIDAVSGWSASREGTVVTITHDQPGELENFNAFYANLLSLGDRTGIGTPAQVTITLEAGTLTNRGFFTYFGVPIYVAASATQNDIATAIFNALDPLEGTAQWPTRLAGWEITSGTGGVLVFTQTSAAPINAAAAVTAFPDNALVSDTTVHVSGINAVPMGYDPTTGVAADTFTIAFGNASNPNGGAFNIFGLDIVYGANATGTQIAGLVETAIAAGVTIGTETWTAVATTGTLVLTSTSNTVAAADQSALFASAVLHDIAMPANATQLEAFLNDNNPTTTNDLPDLTQNPILGENGIEANIVFSFEGQDAAGYQVGTQHPARETFGDADYLDFSAYDAYAVVVGSGNATPILSVADTAGTHHYVRIVEQASTGVYDFTLFDAGTDGIGTNDASLGLIGTVDFGESVHFVASNFILFNDIIV